MNARDRLHIEEPRFALTGGGMCILGLRPEFEEERYPGHCIDAPGMVPRGGLLASAEQFQGKTYVVAVAVQR